MAWSGMSLRTRSVPRPTGRPLCSCTSMRAKRRQACGAAANGGASTSTSCHTCGATSTAGVPVRTTASSARVAWRRSRSACLLPREFAFELAVAVEQHSALLVRDDAAYIHRAIGDLGLGLEQALVVQHGFETA